MLLVGLTGNIAGGKTEVSRLLGECGATVIDSDVLAREVVAPGTPALAAITANWGQSVLSTDGSLNRDALRSSVFQDPDELLELNEIVHPEIEKKRDAAIAVARAKGDMVVVCVVPLLFEKHMADDYDKIVLVDAPRQLRFERLLKKRGIEEAEALRMIAAQMPAELKRARADYVIENIGSITQLQSDVTALWAEMQREAAVAGEGMKVS
ncbi:MAG: dephospho-CoA kinase [Gemmatimonadaceae bacterium]|nr:dephospho-CoA kinase [Gemmatimonadaceae bacterium]